MSTRNSLAPKRLTPDSRITELEHDLDTAQHLQHEIVIAAFRRERSGNQSRVSRLPPASYTKRLLRRWMRGQMFLIG
jgi:hypothetical protein